MESSAFIFSFVQQLGNGSWEGDVRKKNSDSLLKKIRSIPFQ